MRKVKLLEYAGISGLISAVQYLRDSVPMLVLVHTNFTWKTRKEVVEVGRRQHDVIEEGIPPGKFRVCTKILDEVMFSKQAAYCTIVPNTAHTRL